jgi:hypothetical protein
MSANLVGKRIKDNSKRKFRGGGPRPDRNEQKREEALARNLSWQSLHRAEQIAALDRRHGKGLGAKRQRARLARKAAS